MFAVKSLCFYVTRLKGLLYTKKIILIIFERKKNCFCQCESQWGPKHHCWSPL